MRTNAKISRSKPGFATSSPRNVPTRCAGASSSCDPASAHVLQTSGEGCIMDAKTAATGDSEPLASGAEACVPGSLEACGGQF